MAVFLPLCFLLIRNTEEYLLKNGRVALDIYQYLVAYTKVQAARGKYISNGKCTLNLAESFLIYNWKQVAEQSNVFFC